MIRLTPQQSSDLLGAVQEAASQAAGFSHALAVAGQTDAALHFERSLGSKALDMRQSCAYNLSACGSKQDLETEKPA